MLIPLDPKCSANEILNVFGNREEMSKNGWNIDVTDINKDYDSKCRSDLNWYGWGTSGQVGTISTVLKGSGKLTIDFGNCYKQGEVKVYLDSKLMAAAKKNTNNVVKTFSFNQGSLLEIKDEGPNSVIRLNSITFECTGKIQLFELPIFFDY